MVGESTRMACKYQGKPIPDIRWLRHGKAIENDDVKYKISVDNASEKDVTSYLEIIKYVFFKHKSMLFYHLFRGIALDRYITLYLYIFNFSLSHSDNGTYLCHGMNEYHSDVAVMDTVVFDKPQVNLDLVKSVDEDKIYINWTIVRWNTPVTDYYLSYREKDQNSWEYYVLEKISPKANSFVMRNLTANTSYFIKLAAKNK